MLLGRNQAPERTWEAEVEDIHCGCPLLGSLRSCCEAHAEVEVAEVVEVLGSWKAAHATRR